jgi:hypothetical protein
MKHYVIRSNFQNGDALLPDCVISPNDPHYTDCYPQGFQATGTNINHLPGLNVSVTTTGEQNDQAS